MVAPTHVAAYLALLGLIFPVIGPDMPWHSTVVRAEPDEPTAWVVPEFNAKGAPVAAMLVRECTGDLWTTCTQWVAAVWADRSFVFSSVHDWGFSNHQLDPAAWRSALNASTVIVHDDAVTRGRLDGPLADQLLADLGTQNATYVVESAGMCCQFSFTATVWLRGEEAEFEIAEEKGLADLRRLEAEEPRRDFAHGPLERLKHPTQGQVFQVVRQAMENPYSTPTQVVGPCESFGGPRPALGPCEAWPPLSSL